MPRKPKFDLKSACSETIKKILVVAGASREVYLPEIPKIFASLPYAPADRASIFTELDERPGQFGGDYFQWHAPLRQTRNHPEHGPRLFEALR